MKIAYLTWGETPRTYGIYGGQAIRQFCEIKRVMTGAEFHYLSAVPILNSGLVREHIHYPDEIRGVRHALGDIPFTWIPIYAPQTMVNSTARTFGWMHFGAHWHLRRILQSLQPEVIHCRSYHAAWAALVTRKEMKHKFKIVFDARGLYPEEVALKLGQSETDKSYLFLKQIERTLLRECDATVAVSSPMKTHYEHLGSRYCETIYLSTEPDALKPEGGSINSSKSTVDFCYVGALGDDTWHQPAILMKLYRHLRSIVANCRLTIVTTSKQAPIRAHMDGIPPREIDFRAVRNLDQLARILQTMDFGLMSYFEPKSSRERKLAEMVLGVKVPEYLCAGLPVIVNAYCGGAAELVRKHDLGLVYDPCNFQTIDSQAIERYSKSSQTRKRISAVARGLFDYAEHANQYAALYSKLVR